MARGWTGASDVIVDGDRLTFWIDPARRVLPDDELLSAFQRLADDKDGSRIARFVERYGPLGLCEHGLPASHNPPPAHGVPLVGSWCQPEDQEPLETWRLFAGQARALVNVAAALLQGRPGMAIDWQVIHGASPRGMPPWVGDRQAPIETHVLFLVEVVNEWLALGNVRPVMEAPLRAPGAAERFRLALASGLFGAIAVQLASAIARRDPDIYFCDYCGAVVDTSSRERRPQRGKRLFCQDCIAAKVPGRVRAQASRLSRSGRKGGAA